MPTLKLSEVIDAFDMLGDDTVQFYDRKTGRIHVLTEYDRDEMGLDDWDELDEELEGEIADVEIADDEIAGGEEGETSAGTVGDVYDEVRDALSRPDDHVNLPSKFDIHEYEIMARFSQGYRDGRIAQRLGDAIQGRGAFRRFKDALYEHGIEEEWYDFREQALREIAIEWCDANQIAYEDDVPPPRTLEQISKEKKARHYERLADPLRGLLKRQRDPVANMANMAAFLFNNLDDVNWAGFYRLCGDELVLGPFQGPPACVRIAMGQGVCGTAAQRRETLIVPDVHAFPGHIACDPTSIAEIVVPLIKDGELLGVLDLDSPVRGRFDEIDRTGLEQLVEILLKKTDFSKT